MCLACDTPDSLIWPTIEVAALPHPAAATVDADQAARTADPRTVQQGMGPAPLPQPARGEGAGAMGFPR
jgi:hypothetical protein